jgi:hypothetical protein
MNVLITCHKPPGFGHSDLFQLKTKAYKANKTRKNTKRKLSKLGTIYYIDTDTKGSKIPPKSTPHWFSEWASVPDNSMDLIWGHGCPVLEPFHVEELYPRFNFDEPEEAVFLSGEDGESGGGFWRDVLLHGKRILKSGGKIVIPFPLTWEGWVSSSTEISLIARIINMEATKFLYKISVVDSLSEKHTEYLKNTFILNNDDFKRTKNGNTKELKLDEAFKFLVFEKP